MKYKCDYADERNARGHCERKRQTCDGCGDIYERNFDKDKLEVVERKDICAASSIFGNYYIALNAQDVANLVAGKCLALTGEEYNIFLSYDGGAEDA